VLSGIWKCDILIGVNLRHFEAFVAVAEEQSFSRAAERLSVVQSAVSAGIKALELELGAALFQRTGRGALLTDAGTALLPEARATLVSAQAARDAVGDARAGLRGSVRLGIMQAMRPPAPNPAAILAQFGDSHPGVDVIVTHGGGSATMADQVRDGHLDLAFVSLQPPITGVELTPLTSQPIELVCSVDHPLAQRTDVELSMLGGEVFADLPPQWGTRILNDRAFAAAGVTRTIRYEINDTSTLVEFVRSGLAITLFPQSLIGLADGVAMVPIRRHTQVFEVSVAAPSGRRMTAATHALLDAIVASHRG
jgi:DNA-binding transcriptional LysR family regulator